VIAGGCLCGAVRFSAEGPFRPVVACHCSQCRRTSGNFVAATGVLRDGVTVTGEVRWYASSATARRGFCPVCGCPIFWDGPGSHLSIFMGALDQPTGLTTAGHIYCADKGDWYEIADGLPQAPGDDPTLTTMAAG
jgi:hypothetical protein